ncbi:ogr/Delta-like zinc finger family protein [Pectobacterium zantedeschiae]
MLSKETRRIYHQCTNMLCGQSFTTLKTVENYLNNVTPCAKAHIIPAGVFPKSNYGEQQLTLLI